MLRDLGYAPHVIGSQTAQSPAAEETIAGTPVHRVRARSPLSVLGPRAAGPHRWLTAADWHRRAVVRMLRLRPALVHANDHNTMWSAVLAKALLRARVVYDSHELWADRNGRPEWRLWLVACEWIFVRVADAVVTASPGYAAELARRYRIAPPVVVRNVPEGVAITTAQRTPGECVYVGGLMPGRGLEPAIAALALAPTVGLRLVGDGRPDYVEGLRRRAAAAGVSDRVVFHGAVAPGEVVEVASAGGFGLCLIEPICLSYELTLPNKLFEYAASGLPILASDLPVIAATVRAGGLGETVASQDLEAIAAAMERLASPDVNREVRERVARFAAGTTWALEQQRLAAVY